MDLMSFVQLASEVIAGASVAALGLGKVWPLFRKLGPALTAVHKILSAVALNHDKPKDPGPLKPAVGRIKLKGGKSIGFRVPK